MINPVPSRLPPPGSDPQAAKAWKAALDFEAMALGQLLGPMLSTVDTAHGPFGGGSGEEAWKPMMIDAIAKQFAAHGGIGLAVPVFQEMLREQAARSGAAPTASDPVEPAAEGSR